MRKTAHGKRGAGSVLDTRVRFHRVCNFPPPGYTLIEMIVVIAIFTLILTATVAAAIMFYRTNAQTLNQAYAVESARKGMTLLVADFRGAQYGSDGSYPLAAIGGSDLTFYSDTDSDGTPEKVRYYVSGTDLVRDITWSTGAPPAYTGANTVSTSTLYLQNISEGVQPFHFYTSSDAEVTTVTQVTPVAYMTMQLIVNAQGNGTVGDYTLRSTATLRNASQF